MRRKIRQKRNPDFVYQTGFPRRNLEKNAQEVSQGEKLSEKVKDLDQTEAPKEVKVPSPIQLRKFAKQKSPKLPPITPQNSPEIQPTAHVSKTLDFPIQRQKSLPTQLNADKETLDQILDRLYTFKENPSAYSAHLQKYIDRNYSLSLHKQRRKKFRRRPFLVYDPMEAIQADLIFFNSPDLIHANSFYKYILTVIDIFTKKAFCRALKTKNSSEVASALDDIISEFPIIPRKLMVDNGTEFSGSSNAINDIIVTKYKMVIYILTDSEHKAGVVERFNKTLKQRIARFMTENHTKRWVDNLQDIVNNYNETIHRSIGMAPNHVSFQNREEVFARLFPNMEAKVKCKIKPGWRVRIPRKKSIFEKGYTPIWTEEIFVVKQVEKVCCLL